MVHGAWCMCMHEVMGKGHSERVGRLWMESEIDAEGGEGEEGKEVGCAREEAGEDGSENEGQC